MDAAYTFDAVLSLFLTPFFLSSAIPDAIGGSNLSDLNLSKNAITVVPAAAANAPRLKVVRLDEVQQQ